MSLHPSGVSQQLAIKVIRKINKGFNHYLGLNLRSPLVPSAAQPLTEEIDNINMNYTHHLWDGKFCRICSPLLRHGIDHLQEIERELVHWMEEHEY